MRDLPLHKYITSAIKQSAIEHGVAPDVAEKISAAVCLGVRNEYGPGRHYVPAPDRSERNKSIVRQYAQGEKRGDIAKSAGLHRSTIDRVLQAHGDSFGKAEWDL